MNTEQKKTFADLQPGDFIYEIRKYTGDAVALKWRLTGIGNFGRPSENYYEMEVEDPERKRPDEVLFIHVNAFKKSVYNKRRYYADRDEAVAAYKELIMKFAAEANEEVIRLQKQMNMAQSRADKFTERLLKIH